MIMASCIWSQKCPQMTVTEMIKHQDSCEERTVKCILKGCNQDVKKSEYFNHVQICATVYDLVDEKYRDKKKKPQNS